MRDAPGNGTIQGGLWRRLIVAAMPGIGMLIFTAYLYQMTGIWFAWSKTHAAWGRVLGGETPLAGLAGLGSDGLLGFASDHPYDLLNGLGLLLALLPVRAVWRLSPAWTMFVLVNVLVPLAGRRTALDGPPDLDAVPCVPGVRDVDVAAPRDRGHCRVRRRAGTTRRAVLHVEGGLLGCPQLSAFSSQLGPRSRKPSATATPQSGL